MILKVFSCLDGSMILSLAFRETKYQGGYIAACFALLDVFSLVLFLFRCWEEVVESPFWWIIKTPILVSILVKYQHIPLAAKPSLIPSVGGGGVLRRGVRGKCVDR